MFRYTKTDEIVNMTFEEVLELKKPFSSMIQEINISTDLGREELNELGRRSPYFRYMEFPVEVIAEIELLKGLDESNQTASTG